MSAMADQAPSTMARLNDVEAGRLAFWKIGFVAIAPSETRGEAATYVFPSSRALHAPCWKTIKARSRASPMAVPPRNFIGYTASRLHLKPASRL